MANYQVGQPGGDWTGLTQGNANTQAFQAAQQQAEHDRLVAPRRQPLSGSGIVMPAPNRLAADDYDGR